MLKIYLENISETENKSELPSTLWFDDSKSAMVDYIGEDSLAGSIMITGDAGAPAVHVETYIEGFIFDVDQIGSQKVSFVVFSDNTLGQIISVSALRESLGISSENEVVITIDGETIPELNDISELNAGTVGYYRIDDVEGEQILISIPKFQEQQIQLSFISGTGPNKVEELPVWDLGDYAVIIGILIVVLIAALNIYVSRRKD
jgi:hypothetical protein